MSQSSTLTQQRME